MWLPSRRKEPWNVFLSHAGKQKHDIVDAIYNRLRCIMKTKHIFFDVHTLAGFRMDDTLSTINQALDESVIVVFVLSQHFVRTPAAMEELHIALKHHREKGGNTVHLLPVFEGITSTECKQMRTAYEATSWPEELAVDGKSKPSDAQLNVWADDLLQLCKFQGIHPLQRYYLSELAESVALEVVNKLIFIGKLSRNDKSRLEHVLGQRSMTSAYKDKLLAAVLFSALLGGAAAYAIWRMYRSCKRKEEEEKAAERAEI